MPRVVGFDPGLSPLILLVTRLDELRFAFPAMSLCPAMHSVFPRIRAFGLREPVSTNGGGRSAWQDRHSGRVPDARLRGRPTLALALRDGSFIRIAEVNGFGIVGEIADTLAA